MTPNQISIRTTVALLFLLSQTLLFSQKSQSNWKTDIDLGGGFTLTTFLEARTSKDQVTLTSPKNADARLFGGFKSRLGRVMGKSPKKGILVTIIAIQKGDSLIGTALVPVLGKMKFQGILTESLLTGNLIKNDTVVVGTVSGKPSAEHSLDFNYLYPIITDTTQRNIYSRSVLQTDEWKKFDGQLKKLCDKAVDDIELFIGFSMLSPQLPFSHFNLLLQEAETDLDDDSTLTKVPTVFFEEKGANTAYLRIANFSSSTEELAEVFPQIVENKGYEHLIIDLRNNGGGGIEAANEFGRHIIAEHLVVGYFVTNKLEYTGFDAERFGALPEASPETTDEFIAELKATKGAKLVFNRSDSPVFSGKIYVLTNGNTASTCEPIVFLLKEHKLATIVGENTAGAMLSAAMFDLSGKYKLFLPMADFYTFNGVRLDQVGVKPDIETESADALNKVLEIIRRE